MWDGWYHDACMCVIVGYGQHRLPNTLVVVWGGVVIGRGQKPHPIYKPPKAGVSSGEWDTQGCKTVRGGA